MQDRQQLVHGFLTKLVSYKEVAVLTKEEPPFSTFFFYTKLVGPLNKRDRNSVCLGIKQGHGHMQTTERITDSFIYLRSGCVEMISYILLLSLFMEKVLGLHVCQVFCRCIEEIEGKNKWGLKKRYSSLGA